jgi:hypothetical protein
MENFDNANRCRTLPIRPGQKIEAGLRSVHLAEFGNGIGTLIDDLIDPESISEVGDLNDNRFLRQIQDTETLQDVLIWTSNHTLRRLNIVAQHR